MTGSAIRQSARRILELAPWGRSYLASRRNRIEAAQRRRGIEFYRQFVEAGDLCFDIGANVGNRTEMLRNIGARVVAIEPQASCVTHLRHRFDGDEAVAVVGSAVGPRPGRAEIAVCDEDPTVSTMSSRWQNEGRFAGRAWTRSEDVLVTTMDQLVEEHGQPRFCKIDVEGFERQVLEGLSSPLPVISFEFTREFLDDARACVSLLQDLGPVLATASFGETLRLDQEWMDPNRIFSVIDAQPDDLDWGDIYVRSAVV